MTSAGRMLRPHVVRRWRALAGAGGATVALTAADLAKPWPLALVVDRLLAHREAPFTLTAGDARLLAVVAAVVLLIAVVEAGAQYASDLWLQKAGERISHDLRVRVYEHLQRLSLGFHQGRQKGDLVTRVTGDVNAMGDLFSQSLGAMVQAALLSLGMTVVLLVIDPVLALVALATAPLMAALSYVYRRRVRTQSRVRRAEEGHIASIASEALSAMSVVKAFGSEGYESRRVREGSERRLASGVAVARLQARFDGLVGSVKAISTAAVLVIGAIRVSHGAISPGELLVFASYTRKAQSPMRSFARELTKVSATMAKADRIAELLAADDVLPEPPNAYRGARATGDVALEDVSFGYGAERPVLSGVSLRVGPGERLALMGPSGAGKSTLGALVARFFDPTAGRVLIDGRDARDCSLAWLREQVAVVLQDTVLFSGTVHDNIAYATDATREEVVAAARSAAAHEFICALPQGYDTDLGPQGLALSGGQRQRIGVARTLLRDPPILVLDEPTSGLDAASEAAVLDGLQALMRGRTTILITHSPRLAGDRGPRPRARRRAARAAPSGPRPRAAARAAARRRRDARADRPLAGRRAAARRRRGRPGRLQAGRDRRRALPRGRRRRGARRRRDADRGRRPRAADRQRRLRGARAQGGAALGRAGALRRTSSARSSRGCRSTRSCRRSRRSAASSSGAWGCRSAPSPCWSATSRGRARCCGRTGSCSRPTARRATSRRRSPACGRRPRARCAPGRSPARCRSCG